MHLVSLPGNVLDKGADWMSRARKRNTDALSALGLSLAIVTSEVQGGDGFHERVELLFAFVPYDLSGRLVFL